MSKHCPRCNSTNIYYATKESPNEDVAQCGGCDRLIEVDKLIIKNNKSYDRIMAKFNKSKRIKGLTEAEKVKLEGRF